MSKNFSEEQVIDLICNHEIDRIEDGEGRWTKHMRSIVKHADGKLYELYWKKGLTDYGDDYYTKQEAEEVERRTSKKTFTIVEWVKI